MRRKMAADFSYIQRRDSRLVRNSDSELVMVMGRPETWRAVTNCSTRPIDSSSKKSNCRAGNISGTISTVTPLSATATCLASRAETSSVSTAVKWRKSSNHSMWSISSRKLGCVSCTSMERCPTLERMADDWLSTAAKCETCQSYPWHEA